MIKCSALGYSNWCHYRAGWKEPQFGGSGLLNADNLQYQQLSIPAYTTSAAATITADLGEQREVQAVGLIGHTLPDGAEIEFSDGSQPLAQVTHQTQPYSRGVQNTIVALPDVVDTDTVEVQITNGAAAQIGVLWAGPLVSMRQVPGWGITGQSVAPISYSTSGAAWSAPAAHYYETQILSRYSTERPVWWGTGGAQIMALPDWDVDNSFRQSGNAYQFLAISGTLLSVTDYFEAGKRYEVEINVSDPQGMMSVTAGGQTTPLSAGDNRVEVDGSAGQDLVISAQGTVANVLALAITIQQVEDRKPSIKRAVEYAGATEPVLWLPKLCPSWIQEGAIYGHIQPGWRIAHVAARVWDVGMDIRQAL